MSNQLKIFNSLTGKKEVFKPLKKNKVGLYVCGMTVYDYCHIGHARILVIFDIIARHLRSLRYDLTYVRNITDIDDKIIARAHEKNQSFSQLTEFFIEKMHQDEQKLGNQPPDLQPKATDHIDEIIKMINQLIKNEIAYVSENDTVYFHTRKFKNYGKLSGKKLDELREGARIEIEEAKEDPLDFVLWKPAKENEPSWDSPWGKGRPGWHIECSAMSCTHLGNNFDLHGGGGDLKFPHHENEIAQSQGATGANFAKGWIHIGFVNIDNQKMSKSLNNFFTIREVFQHFDPEVVRYFLLSSHYRKPLNYSNQNLNLAKQGLNRLYSALRNNFAVSGNAPEPISALIDKFNLAMNDDFNTPNALVVLFDLVKKINTQKQLIESNSANTPDSKDLLDSKNLLNLTTEMEYLLRLQKTLTLLGSHLGILRQNANDFFTAKQPASIDEELIAEKIKQRNQAREAKNFQLADQIRDQLQQNGIVLEDSSGQTIWRLLPK